MALPNYWAWYDNHSDGDCYYGRIPGRMLQGEVGLFELRVKSRVVAWSKRPSMNDLLLRLGSLDMFSRHSRYRASLK